MGVSIHTRNADWSYPYSTFMRVREILGDLSGIKTGAMSPYFDKGLWGFWKPEDEVPDDLIYLQSHQDCEGIFMPYTAEKIGVRVRRLLSDNDIEPDMRKIIVELVEVLESSAENWDVVVFS